MDLKQAEKHYSEGYKLNGNIPPQYEEEMIRALRLFSFNYSCALQYYLALKALDQIDYSQDRFPFLYTSNGALIDAHALAIRRLTDKQSRLSVRYLINTTYKQDNDDYINATAVVDRIHNSYSKFNDQGNAHQDNQDLHIKFSNFPDNPIIEHALTDLQTLYDNLARKSCSEYVPLIIRSDIKDYDREIRAIVDNI